MKTQTINIRELHSQLKRIYGETLRGRSFVVIKNAKPVFRIEPVSKEGPRKYTLRDIERIQFKSGRRKLSKEIDNMLYSA
jgi:antitoxin (DNA-binding transcriptional repressor) of toxin-antitoxin stability system